MNVVTFGCPIDTMPLFGHKKTRSAKSASLTRQSSSWWRWLQVLKNRKVLLRMTLSMLAMLALMVAVEAWKAPFPYRLGDRPVHGVAAKVAFERENRQETERARSLQETMVPRYFIHNVALLDRMVPTFRDDLHIVAETPALDQLPIEIRTIFGLAAQPDLTDPTTPKEKTADPRQVYELLRKAVTREGKPDEEAIDQLTADFGKLIEPLREIGVADQDELTLHQIRSSQGIVVTTKAQPQQQRSLSVRDVRLSEQMKSTGVIGQRWTQFPRLNELRGPLTNWLLTRTPPTLQYDLATTQQAQREAREQTPTVTDHFDRGIVLVQPGEPIDEDTLELLHAEFDEAESHVPFSQRVARMATVFFMIAVLAVLNGYYLIRNQTRLVRSTGRLSLYLIAIVLTVALGRWLSYDPWRAEVIPLLITVMIFAIAYDQVLATLTGFTLALVVTLSTVSHLEQFVVVMSVLATSVISLPHVPSRSVVIKAGFLSGLVYFFVYVAMGITEAQSIIEAWSNRALLVEGLWGAGACVAAGYFVAGSLPFIESTFGVVTDISLLEMSDVSHPLLQELVRRAPGTYNHSITVATIAEAAAESIGGNGLLVRVGAYFHDVGKMLKPQYFIENMSADDRSKHEHLAPAMSTLIIIGHVKDGADLARQHNLPEPVIEFVEQHHGTTLVEYFYHEAARQAESQPDHKTDADESSFRYPGPKPQSREAGVLMLSDAVEGASRTLSEPTPKRIETLVHAITMKRLLDGQFDECSLTLSELRSIEESLTKSLISIYHGRVKYPDQRTA